MFYKSCCKNLRQTVEVLYWRFRFLAFYILVNGTNIVPRRCDEVHDYFCRASKSMSSRDETLNNEIHHYYISRFILVQIYKYVHFIQHMQKYQK
jgi:hypothetical protein